MNPLMLQTSKKDLSLRPALALSEVEDRLAFQDMGVGFEGPETLVKDAVFLTKASELGIVVRVPVKPVL